MKVIGIAGGSGAGKSTVAYELVDSEPDIFEVLNFDDYQKVGLTVEQKALLPWVEGMVNWEHPDVIRWDDLKKDIDTLKSGKEVQIETWAHRSNPDFNVHHQKISRIVHPRPILLVEGYLALYGDIIDVYDKTFYLDLGSEIRAERRRQARRRKDILQDPAGYAEKVLIPMYKEFVEPARKVANFVIDVSCKSIEEVAYAIRSKTIVVAIARSGNAKNSA
jgi:uridine kinase